jgi:hypothetical protein
MAKDDVADPNRPCPSVAMVSVDGGRLQIRSEPEPTPEPRWSAGTIDEAGSLSEFSTMERRMGSLGATIKRSG